MRNRFWSRISRIGAIVALIVVSLFVPLSARADVAPPAQPPGANVAPGDESTQVRMMAETVTMTVLPKASPGKLATLKAAAVFTMNNTGSQEEKMQVRFPLTFWNGDSDGFGHYPEIREVQIKVDGKGVATHRIDVQQGGVAFDQVPWTAFDVTFPSGQDVTLEVDYTADGFGYDKGVYANFGYVLETGAGWKGTIGSGDIIVRLPYQANNQNIMYDENLGFGVNSSGGQISGNEIRWHFDDLEPTRESNIQVVLVTPEQWQKVLTETDNIATNPNDSEAWGRRGKAYKELLPLHHSLRADEGGRAIYTASVQDYEKAVTLAPDDAEWHYGFADLLWQHFEDANYMMGYGGDEAELVRAMEQLSRSLELDPNDQRARYLADWIGGAFPGAIEQAGSGSGYVFAGLTATPVMLSPTPWASATPTAEVAGPGPTPTPEALVEESTPTPVASSGGSPLCGGAVLVLPILLFAVWVSRREL